MRVGFIGIGRIGSLHADATRRHPGVTAMVLTDQDRDRASRAASRLGCESADSDADNSAALLSLDDGTLATLQGSLYNGGGYDVRMELAGSQAAYAVGLDDHAALISAEPDAGFPAAAPRRNFWDRFGPAYRAEINAFIDVAEGTRPSPCTVEEAMEALYAAEAATLSRAEGRPVAVAEVRR